MNYSPWYCKNCGEQEAKGFCLTQQGHKAIPSKVCLPITLLTTNLSFAIWHYSPPWCLLSYLKVMPLLRTYGSFPFAYSIYLILRTALLLVKSQCQPMFWSLCWWRLACKPTENTKSPSTACVQRARPTWAPPWQSESRMGSKKTLLPRITSATD